MKLKLKIEDLAITSFETHSARSARGTVHARISADTGEATCAGWGEQCGWTAQLTICYGACDGVSGLSCACATMGCTADPRDFRCYVDSVNVCPETIEANC
ncbi:hypothetical protein [Longimicrobium sp.]|uniref:hypothetical protein n=1 Tax=Longimicrobium sp. TaxID=2029185 RepID=UPI002CCD83F8|nr:hypothetical protein [Longimicrobium sp.]HSU14635.1 hypothetical protein [Longimicrobium sp.]